MNAQQANRILLSLILEKLGFTPERKTANEYWYLSPFRNERTASFKVRLRENDWFDHGIGEGGNVVDFGCAYLKSCGHAHSPKDALKFLQELGTDIFNVNSGPRESFENAGSRLSIKSVQTLTHKKLKDYLESRGICPKLAKTYLKEVHLHNKNTDKKMFMLGLPNEEEGFELKNAIFQGSFPEKGVSFIRGSKPLTKDIHVFEGMMDFLSALIAFERKNMEGDSLVLNSVSNLRRGLPYITSMNYHNLYSWMDNDVAGKRATMLLEAMSRQHDDLVHTPMNQMYMPHKDVNEWHMKVLGLMKL